MKTTIVTGADARFFEMLTELLDSIERCQPADPDQRLDICVLDVGLTAPQKAQLEARVTRVVDPGWDFDFPGRDRLPRHYQAMFARPQLPQHLPGYDRYMWMDCDVWLQDWRAVELFLKASEQPVIAIVPEIHQSYGHVFRQQPGLEQGLKTYYETMFGPDTGKWLKTLPIYNAGVWAMRGDLVYWRNWGDVLRRGLKRFTGFLSEQCCLNMAIYTGLITGYALPAWCNWMCSQALPAIDTSTHTVHSPLLPHEKISILHLAGDVKRKPVEVECLDGRKRLTPLTYSGVMAAGR